MMKRQKNVLVAKKGGGFTVIELMMAMVVMAIGTVAIVHMGVVASRGHGYSREWMEAYDIAQMVLEDLRTRALGWATQQGCTATSLDNLVPQNVPAEISKPFPNNDLGFADLRSWPVLDSQTISAGGGVNFTDSEVTNLFGYNPNTAANDIQGLRATYRVHFVAHRVPYGGTDMCTANQGLQMVRITVFVSWDNKDHGAQSGVWDSFQDESDFWNRHMVTMTTFIIPEFRWSA